MSLVLNVEILGEFRNLTKATQGSQSELSKLNKKITGFSNSAKNAFASIGVGLSFAFIARELGDATKAAIEDTKSQAQLARQLEISTGANKDQIASVEKSIDALSRQAGVADDELRPAMATLIRNTGSITESQKLMAIALDVSAATGKDLDAVSLALSKSFNGNDAALIKLLPSVKGMKDPLTELARQFDGAAEAAANNDPMARMTIIFGELEEKIGTALLPTLTRLSTWLASPGGTKALELVSDAIVTILNDAITMANWVVANKNWVLPLATGVAAITTAWKAATVAVNAYKAAALAAAAIKAVTGGAAAAAGAGAAAGGAAAGGAAAAAGLAGFAGLGVAVGAGAGALLNWEAGKTERDAWGSIVNSGNKTDAPITIRRQSLGAPAGQTVVNVNVSQAVTARTIIDTVAKYEAATGSTLSQALR
jgi:hypothetical protein